MAKRILAIDDNEDILDTLNLILTIEGFEVETSLSPLDIDKQVINFRPDLILLDIQMGRYNGLEVCKNIKTNLYTNDVPVIIISSHESISRAIKEYGADGIILKPFDINTLLNKIATFIDGKDDDEYYKRASA